MATHQSGDTIRCTKCGKDQEGVVEDYVIPGRIGEASRAADECYNCGAPYSVMTSDAGAFIVEFDPE